MFKTREKSRAFLSGVRTIGLLYPPKIQPTRKTFYSAWEEVQNCFSSVGNDLQFAIKNEKK